MNKPMKTAFIFSLMSIAVIAGASSLRADEAEADDLIQQVIAQASKSADAATAAQVQQYVGEHRAAIQAILQSYRAQLKQADEAGEVNIEGTAAASAPANVMQGRAPEDSRVAVVPRSGGGLQIGSLQTGSLQPSSKLQGAHLDGYPALPNVAPATSVVNPTAAQLEHARQVDEAIRERKRVHMQNPAHYAR